MLWFLDGKKKGGVVKYSHISAGGHNSPFRRIETKSVRSLWHKSIVIRHSNVLHSYKWHYELGNVRFGFGVCVCVSVYGIFVYLFIYLSIHICMFGCSEMAKRLETQNAKCALMKMKTENQCEISSWHGKQRTQYIF